jgi:hypothetical protein
MTEQPITMTNFKSLPREQLEQMAEAGTLILECYRVLQKTEENVVSHVLQTRDDFYEWDHYPDGDVYDHETHSQHYYHAHPPEERSKKYGHEHGHFHTFLRPKGFPRGIKPVPLADLEKPESPNDALCHLIGISMNQAGYPIRLFTTNRWVTGETWYKADHVIKMLDHFVMDLTFPSWPVNIWITNMIQLFRPQIEDLILKRDTALAEWETTHPGENVYEDEELELPSLLDISVEKQIKEVTRALKK